MKTGNRPNKPLLIVLAVLLSLTLLFTSFVVYAEAGRGQSYQSLAVEGVFRVLMISKRHRSIEGCLKRLEVSRVSNENYKVPQNYIDNYNLAIYTVNDFEVCVFNEEATSGKYIFYLHGGAFVDQPLIFHYEFLERLSTDMDCTIVMPVYPKAPNYTFETAIPMVVNTYKDLLNRVDSNNITVMGDSAGASMSLSVCQYFNEANIPQPKDIIVFSPCMDGTMSNPEIYDYENRDLLLAMNVLKTKLNSYAGGEANLTNYLVSPICGDFHNLAPITLFTGTEEVLLPDMQLFHEKAIAEGIDLTYYEYNNMLHVFPLYPIPEGEEVRGIINNIILGE